MEPDDAPSRANDTIGRAQRLAGEEHAGCFEAPALFVVRMNVFVPADGIFQPFFARVSKGGLDLGADICLADSAIEIGHEDHGGNLLQKRAILCLEI